MTGAQTQTLEAGIRAKTSPQRVVLRSRICLLAAEGLPPNAMAHRWETSRPTVRLWRTGFNEAGPVGSVLGTGYPRHRHEEWLKFLPVIDRDTSPGQALHVILDNDGRTTTPRSRSDWRDLHDFICTVRRRVPRG